MNPRERFKYVPVGRFSTFSFCKWSKNYKQNYDVRVVQHGRELHPQDDDWRTHTRSHCEEDAFEPDQIELISQGFFWMSFIRLPFQERKEAIIMRILQTRIAAATVDNWFEFLFPSVCPEYREEKNGTLGWPEFPNEFELTQLPAHTQQSSAWS